MMTLTNFAKLIAVLAVLGTTATANDWSQWRGPNRDGKVAAATAVTNDASIEELWSAEVGTGFSSIAISGDRVVTSGNVDDEDTIFCLSRADGSALWKHSYPAPLDPNLFEGGPTATPTVSGDSVFVISRKGEIFCLEIGSGEVRWHTQVPEEVRDHVPAWGFTGSPLAHHDTVIFNVGSHGLCLKKENGEVVWKSDTSELAGYTSPILMKTENAELLLIESEKSLKAVDPATGELSWSHPWITRYGINAADPLVVSPTQVVLTSGYAKGASLLNIKANGADEVWRSRSLRCQMSPGVLVDGFIYSNDGDAGQECKLVCVDVSTGKPTWTQDGYGSCSMIAVGQQLFLLSEGGELAIIEVNSKEHQLVAKFPILTGKCWTPPVYQDGTLIARNAVGQVVCVKINPQ
ncbi:PQQ-binding-like beta-propeller repeat protein [Planctomicrobium sp. SH668]|uniref:PQQ-binding-like beta-propeller repeat protein n=1 Tax=Planctomicrobium sp. SH668 TaxID=3448126 RepID=UPI003F5C8613